jgi:hypothetical protein
MKVGLDLIPEKPLEGHGGNPEISVYDNDDDNLDFLHETL